MSRLLYPGCATAADVAAEGIKISLDVILEPMVKISRPEKKRYAYASAAPTKENRCGVCGHQFHKNNKKYVLRIMLCALLTMADQGRIE